MEGRRLQRMLAQGSVLAALLTPSGCAADVASPSAASSAAGSAAGVSPTATPTALPDPTPLPEPGATLACDLDLALTGAIELLLPFTVMAQVGWSGSPEAWGITAVGGDLSLPLPDGGALPVTWRLLASDLDGEGPRGSLFTMGFVGPLITVGGGASPNASSDLPIEQGPSGAPSSTITLFWAEDGSAEASQPPGIGTVAWRNRSSVVIDVTFRAMEAVAYHPSVPNLPEGEVRAVGSITC